MQDLMSKTATPHTYPIRTATAKDIPELRELFRSTVLTVNAKDYTPEETADWASCGDSTAHWEKLLAGLHFLRHRTKAAVSSDFLPSGTTVICIPCLSTRTGKEKAWLPHCCRKRRSTPSVSLAQRKSLRKQASRRARFSKSKDTPL